MEMDRIRREYASSSDEEEENKKVRNATKVKPKSKEQEETKNHGRRKNSGYLNNWLKIPSPVAKIDFEDAHDEWNANKKRKSNGNYAYICGAPLKNGKKCIRECCDKIGLYSGCQAHYSWEESKNINSLN
jgi:hypothetical protein